MKEWMKAITGILIAGLAFVLAGNMSVYAAATVDDDAIVKIISVSYNGDPVYYDDAIDEDDFRVRVQYGDGKTAYLSAADFTISPSVMESTSYERVTVTVAGATGNLKWVVKVKSAGAVLESIEADYDGDDLIVGGQVDENDVDVTAYYNDGSKKKVSGWEFDGRDYKNLDEGVNYITIVYEDGDYEAEDDIRVYAYKGDLTKIRAVYNGGSVKTGGTVSKNNISVTAIYDTNSGNVSQRIYDFSLRSYYITEGNNTITVYYNDGKKTYEDTIIVKGVSSTGTTSTSAKPTGTGNWEAVNGKWMYKENGTYRANCWVQSAASGLWYWMEADGTMAANTWHNDNGTWYWLQADGSMATGWVYVNGQWYYMDDINGNMCIGWKWYKGKCYYLDPVSGAMATNCWIANYYVDGSGVWTLTR